MRRVLMMIAAMACICACTKEEPGIEAFETQMSKIYGNYQLTDVQWPGLPVDMNDDVTAYWDLLPELKNKIGYYEPDYVATVGEGIIFNEEDEWAEYAVGFNVTLPYPKYEISDGKWICTEISSIKMTIRATEDTFKLYKNCCWTYPGNNCTDDPFLSNIKDFSLYIESLNDNWFQIGVHCRMPHDDSDGNQTLGENYLYYTFRRK